MSKGLVRYLDKCSGHQNYPPRRCISGSSTVFINGIGAHRKGDLWDRHCNSDHCHTGISIQGSSNVFIDGQAAVRAGDQIDCGSVAFEGSSNVFCNG